MTAPDLTAYYRDMAERRGRRILRANRLRLAIFDGLTTDLYQIREELGEIVFGPDEETPTPEGAPPSSSSSPTPTRPAPSAAGPGSSPTPAGGPAPAAPSASNAPASGGPDPHPFTPDNTAAVVCVHGLRYDGKAWLFCGRTAEDAVHAKAAAISEAPACHIGRCERLAAGGPPCGVSCERAADLEVSDATLTAWANGTHTLGMVPRLISAVRAARAQGLGYYTDWSAAADRAETAEDDLRVARAALATAHADRDRWKVEALTSRRQINEAHAHLEAAGAKTIRHVIRQRDRAGDEVVRLTGALAAQTERAEEAEADATEWRNGFARAAWEAGLDACAHCRKRADDAVQSVADAQRETVAVREELARVNADRRDRLNADCQAIGDQLDRIKLTAYRQALADAATCHVRAAGKWAAEPITHPGRTLNLYAYTESARVLTAWADDPTRMDGPLRGAGRTRGGA